MSDQFLTQYRQHESNSIAMSVQLNRWSRVMIQQMIQELEKKMIASDLPVDEGNKAEHWGRILPDSLRIRGYVSVIPL